MVTTAVPQSIVNEFIPKQSSDGQCTAPLRPASLEELALERALVPEHIVNDFKKIADARAAVESSKRTIQDKIEAIDFLQKQGGKEAAEALVSGLTPRSYEDPNRIVGGPEPFFVSLVQLSAARALFQVDPDRLLAIMQDPKAMPVVRAPCVRALTIDPATQILALNTLALLLHEPSSGLTQIVLTNLEQIIRNGYGHVVHKSFPDAMRKIIEFVSDSESSPAELRARALTLAKQCPYQEIETEQLAILQSGERGARSIVALEILLGSNNPQIKKRIAEIFASPESDRGIRSRIALGASIESPDLMRAACAIVQHSLDMSEWVLAANILRRGPIDSATKAAFRVATTNPRQSCEILDWIDENLEPKHFDAHAELAKVLTKPGMLTRAYFGWRGFIESIQSVSREPAPILRHRIALDLMKAEPSQEIRTEVIGPLLSHKLPWIRTEAAALIGANNEQARAVLVSALDLPAKILRKNGSAEEVAMNALVHVPGDDISRRFLRIMERAEYPAELVRVAKLCRDRLNYLSGNRLQNQGNRVIAAKVIQILAQRGSPKPSSNLVENFALLIAASPLIRERYPRIGKLVHAMAQDERSIYQVPARNILGVRHRARVSGGAGEAK